MPAPDSQMLIYQPEDGRTRIDVRLEDQTVWLSQAQMVDLFQSSKQNISLHIRSIYEEGELDETATVKEYLTVRTEGNREVQRDFEGKHSFRPSRARAGRALACPSQRAYQAHSNC